MLTILLVQIDMKTTNTTLQGERLKAFRGITCCYFITIWPVTFSLCYPHSDLQLEQRFLMDI